MPTRAHVDQLMTDMTRMGKAFTALRALFPTPYGVDPASLPLLLKLDCASMRVGALAELVHSDISTVSRQATALAEQGFVSKTPDPDDRRAQLLELTDRGRVVAEQWREFRGRMVTELLKDWPDDQLIGVTESLGALVDAIEAAVRSDDFRRALPQLAQL